MKTKVYLGSLSHGTLRSEDLLESFVSELKRLGYRGKRQGPFQRACRIVRMTSELSPAGEELASELVNALQDLLGEYAPPFCYFGTHPGDGSDFGFWVCEDWREQAEDDGCPIVSDSGELPEGFDSGLWFSVSDHGNTTLWNRAKGMDSEVWATV